ncbi:MAG: aldehyde dehydrogenase family protein [Gemmatimonadota bacterium]|nr:aldehyde dehydrogenase family protein [Gemmatimonadota bacterium]
MTPSVAPTAPAPPVALPDVAAALARARAAQRPWAALSNRARARRLRDVRRMLVAHLDEIATTVREETGKPPIEALMHEVLNVLQLVRHYERRAPRVLRRKRVPTGILLSKHAYKQYEPLGVVGVISPWNFPFMLPALPTIAALVAGNAVILKPSEIAPRSGRLLGTLIQRALPDFPDLVQVVEGDGRVGAALVTSGVDKIAFIGGSPTGKKVYRAAAESLTPVVLELGGNDVAIVCDDADVERAAAGVAWGAMANAGQCCIGIERALVAAPIHDRFVAALKREVARIRVGTGERADMSRLIFAPQRGILDGLVADAEARGAEVVRMSLPEDADPRLYPPTILLGATADMEVNRSEAFGPLVSIIKVRDDAEAIALNNDSPFGLSPSIWTRNRRRARRIADRLQAGLITVNDHLMGFAVSGLPYGGVKESGFGRLMGDEGLLEFVQVKSVAGARVTFKREPQWFPYRPGDVGLMRRWLALWFTPGLTAKVRGALRGSGAVARRDHPQ